MAKLTDKIVRPDFKAAALAEWNQLDNQQKKYVSYLLQTEYKYSNPNNSSLLYALGITDQPPTGKVTAISGSYPDIDLDFCEVRRDEVIEYVKQRYGSSCVARIGTFGQLKAKAAIRDVTRTLGLPYDVGDELAKLILPPIEGKPQNLETCIEKVTELTSFYQNQNSDEGRILRWAKRLEDRIRSQGQHASGVVLSDQPVWKYIPVFAGKDKEPTTQWSMFEVEEAGLVKFDFLGLRALTTIKRCVDLIESSRGERLDIQSVPLDDDDTYHLFCRGDLEGVFQFEGSASMRDLVIQAKPTNLEDLASLNATFRPGPLGSGMTAQYIQIRSGQKEPEYLVPELEPILSPTGGLIIFQEQVLEICKQLAGYTLSDADKVRKILGKKQVEKMPAEKEKFAKGITEHGFSQTVADKLFEQISMFAAYSFNKAHAIAYSFLGYQMAYLKAHYPVEFICACLTSDSDEPEKVIRYLEHCRAKRISVLPPDVNESNADFSLSADKQGIRFGLSAIKNIGVGPVGIILSERTAKPFSSLQDFLTRDAIRRINRRQVESLILAGAFDSLEPNRARALDIVDKIWDHRELFQRYESKMTTYQKKLIAYQERETERQAGAKKASLKIPVEPEVPVLLDSATIEDLPIHDRLAQERELIGFYVSGHPLDHVTKGDPGKCFTIADIKEKELAGLFVLAVPSLIKEITVKSSKQRMAFVTLEDKTGTIEATIGPKVYAAFHQLLKEGIPAAFKCSTEKVETEDAKVVKLRVKAIHEIPGVDYNPQQVNLRHQEQKTEIVDVALSELPETVTRITSRNKKTRLTVHIRDLTIDFGEVNVGGETRQ